MACDWRVIGACRYIRWRSNRVRAMVRGMVMVKDWYLARGGKTGRGVLWFLATRGLMGDMGVRRFPARGIRVEGEGWSRGY